MISTSNKKLPFTTKQQEDICLTVLHSTTRALEGQAERNSRYEQWDMQADGNPGWMGIGPRWRGGCEAEDPMTDEHLFEQTASLVYVHQQHADRYMVTETEDADQESAAILEAWMNDKVTELQMNGARLYNLAHYAPRFSHGVMFAGWQQSYTTDYRAVMRHKETDRIAEMDAEEVGKSPDDYEETSEEIPAVDKDGMDVRTPHPADIFLDPPTSSSIKEAQRIIERFEYTKYDLLKGVKDKGFDKHEVAKLIKQGPDGQRENSLRKLHDDINGIEDDGELYTVYMIIGKVPVLTDEDGYNVYSDDDLDRDYVWMVCPAQNICFKFEASPYNKRPYCKFPWRERPGEWVGYSLPWMVSPLQREATIAFRFGIDFRDIYMSSPLMVPDTMDSKAWDIYSTYPGAMFPYDPKYGTGAIAPIPYNPAGFAAAQAGYQSNIQRVDQYLSADARGPAAQVQRTATEAAQAGAGADEKLDLCLTNFNQGWEDFADIMLSHYRQFSSSSGETRNIGGKSITLTPEILRKKYRITVTGSSSNANPMMRYQKAETLATYAKQSPMLAQQIQQGNWTGVYAIESRLLHLLGINDPQTIIGREPQAPPTADYVLQALMPIAQQYAQNGDPGAIALLQAAQQLMQSQQGGQQAQGPPQGQGGQSQQQHGGQPQPKINMSMNLKDMDPQDQSAFLQMVGLPGGQQQNGVHPQGAAQ